MKKKVSFLFLWVFMQIACIENIKSQITCYSGINNGSYHQIATDIKKISSQKIEVRKTVGSVENFESILLSERPTIAFVQFDELLYQRMEDSIQKTKDLSNIRILFPLGEEVVHLIVNKNSKISSLKDLKKKKVVCGNKLFGTRRTAEVIKKLLGIQWTDVDSELDDGMNLLLYEQVDAVLFVAAYPVKKFMELNKLYHTRIKLVDIAKEMSGVNYMTLDSIEKTVYHKTKIPANTYIWQKEECETFAVPFMVITNVTEKNAANVAIIDKLLSEIQANFSLLKESGHEIWKKMELDYEEFDFPLYPGIKEKLKK